MSYMRQLDLFSGIGGFALAARWAWEKEHEIISFVENNKYCQKILAENFPGVPIHGDIKTFDARKYRRTVDLLTGGFPCQPYSIAGKQKGAGDDRALWHEMFRVIQECQPTWIIGENVPQLANMELDQVLFDLEGEDYETQTFNIPACAVDAWHKRKRLWILAYSGHWARRDVGIAKKGCNAAQKRTTYEQSKTDANSKGERHLYRQNEIKSTKTGIDAQCKSNGFCKNASNSNKFNGDISRFRASKISQLKAFQIFRDNKTNWQWTTEPDVGRVANGISSALDGTLRMNRLKALGNAIVPQVAYVFTQAIKEINYISKKRNIE
jgi:DNA (cytosine-5)-methyltransferase 1